MDRRAEIYSFALSRLHDLSPSEAQRMIEGRSTAARLLEAEAQLTSTKTWLGSRLGIDLAAPYVTVIGGSGEGEGEDAAAAATSPRPRKWWRQVKAKVGQIATELSAPPAKPGLTDGWEAMQESVF